MDKYYGMKKVDVTLTANESVKENRKRKRSFYRSFWNISFFVAAAVVLIGYFILADSEIIENVAFIVGAVFGK